MKKQKVFGIGFHKTGTKSLALALKHLGYRVTGPNGVSNPRIASEVYAMAYALADQFDAFQDNPWPLLYKELDQKYPGSKFILTLRPTADWIKSVVGHFGNASTPMREWIYGIGHPGGNEQIYTSRYERHNKEVLEHFANRENDFLVLNITEGAGWPELCRFLGEETPATEFPDINKAADRKKATEPPSKTR